MDDDFFELIEYCEPSHKNLPIPGIEEPNQMSLKGMGKFENKIICCKCGKLFKHRSDRIYQYYDNFDGVFHRWCSKKCAREEYGDDFNDFQ